MNLVKKYSRKIFREVLRLFLPIEQRERILGYFYPDDRIGYIVRTIKFDIRDIDILLESQQLYPKNIISVEQTMEYFLNNEISISRIGDGEELCNILSTSVQFPEMSRRLREILAKGSDNKCLVCINNFNVFDRTIPEFYRKAYAWTWSKRFSVKDMMKNVKYNLTDNYGDAYFLLFYFKETDSAETKLAKLMEIKNKKFDGKKILYVLSGQSNIPKDDFFFNGAVEKKFIIAPPHNAFSEYDRIYSKITENYATDWLVYLELGACATILSWALTQKGYQAIDAGDFYNRIVIPIKKCK